MKKTILSVPFVILALVLLPLNSFAQLRYNLESGKEYLLNQMTVQDITQNIQGMSQNIKNTIGGDVSIKILSKDGHVYTSDFIFKTLVFKMESAMFSMNYDSSAKDQDDNPMAKMLNQLVGHVFKMKFTDRGEVMEVKGFEQLLERMSSEVEQGMMGSIKESLKSQFSDESMKNSVGAMLLFYPDEKIKAGYTWNGEVKTSGALATNSKYAYKIDSADSNIVKISGVGTMVTEDGNENVQNGMTQHFDLKGDVSMTARVDAKTGWLISMTQNQNLEGNVSVESAQLPAPMEIPMTIKGSSTYKAL